MSRLGFELPVDEIIKRYNIGESIKSIANSFNVDPSTIKNRLVKSNINIRKHSDQSQKIKYDRKYFKEIDDYFKAYFLGFILGDGIITTTPYFLNIEIHEKDKILLKQFANLIGLDEINIKSSKQYPKQKKITLTSKEICDDLNKQGIPYRNKSYVAKPIDVGIFQNAFWCGLWDADGSISKTTNYCKAPSYEFELTGTKELCEGFSKHFGFDEKKVKKRSNTKAYRFRVVLSKMNDIFEIYGKLYEDAPFWLPRKRDSFTNFIQERLYYEVKEMEDNPYYNRALIKEIKDLYMSNMSLREISRVMGISRFIVTRICELEGIKSK